MGEDSGRNTRRVLSVPEAADALGVTVDAVRSRIKRGTIAHERQDGRVYVLLNADQARPGRDQPTDLPGESGTLISQMQGRIDSLERQLEEATDRDRENRRTIAALTSSLEEANRENRRVILALTSRFPAIEAPQEATDAPETGEEEPEGAEPRPTAAEAQEPAWRRWRRRVLGR